jgi:DNA-binding MarR family transcriptional regulator
MVASRISRTSSPAAETGAAETGAVETAAAETAAAEALPAPADSVEASTRVLRRFRLVFNAVKTHFQQVEKKAGIGGAQVWALSVIRDHPGIGVNALARAMDIHQTTASNLVKALVVAKLVATEKSAEDRRAVLLHILPEGTQVLHKAPGPFTGVLPLALASLDEETLKRLDHDLSLLITALGADDSAAGIPLAQM